MSAVANPVDTPASKDQKALQANNSAVKNEAKALADLITHKPLPIFEQTLQTLHQFYDKPSSSIPKVVDCLSLDPGYAYQILTKANEGLTKLGRERANTLQHAVLVLGIPQVIELGKQYPLLSNLEHSAQKSSIYKLISRLYHAGVQARELVSDLDENTRESAFLSAQLRDAYQIGLWHDAPQKIEALGASSIVLNEVGKIIAEQLKLPLTVQQSYDVQHGANRLVTTTAIANHISLLAETSWYSEAMENLIEQYTVPMCMTAAELYHRVHQSALMAANESMSYPVKPAACRLVELPIVDKPDAKPVATPAQVAPRQAPVPQEQQPVPAPIVSPKKPAHTQATEATPTQKPKAKPPTESTPSTLELGLLKLESLGKNKHSPQEILEFGFKLLQDNLQDSPLGFFLVDRNKAFLKPRFLANFSSEKKSIAISLKPKSIFKALMQKQQAILIAANNREKYTSLLPSSLPLAVHEKDFSAFSVFVKNRPIGLFYLESKSGQAISVNDYQPFITICKATISSLTEVTTNA